MAINRPPVTGNPSVDSWADEVTRALQQPSSTTTTSGSDVDIDAIVDAVVARVRPTNAVTLVLYKRWNEAALPTSEYIGVDTEYTYSSGVLRDLTTNSITEYDGWTREIPDASEGAWLYSCQVNIADTSPSETISFSNWSNPVIVAVSVDQVTQVYTLSSSGILFFNYDNQFDNTPDPQFRDVTVTATPNTGQTYSCTVRVAINNGVTFSNVNTTNSTAAIVAGDTNDFQIDYYTITLEDSTHKSLLLSVTFKPTGQNRILNGSITLIDSIN